MTLRRVPAVTEAGWMTTVAEFAMLNGFKVVHIRPARVKGGWRTPVQWDGAGLPDLLCFRPSDGRRVAIETKVAGRRLTPWQRDWMAWLAACGFECHVFDAHRTDWREVEKVLRRVP